RLVGVNGRRDRVDGAQQVVIWRDVVRVGDLDRAPQPEREVHLGRAVLPDQIVEARGEAEAADVDVGHVRHPGRVRLEIDAVETRAARIERGDGGTTHVDDSRL